ncbi:MAG: sulfatase, partial [Acidobacteriota bacterium]
MNDKANSLSEITRRHFFRQTGFGIGAMALASLANQNIFASADNDTPRGPHFAPKAKRVIFLFMA